MNVNTSSSIEIAHADAQALQPAGGSPPVAGEPKNAVQWILSGRLHPDASNQDVPVQAQPFTIGRRPDNSLCLNNETVSSRHAELFLVRDDLLVRDHGSTNGTLINGNPVKSVCRLCDGDMLHMGTAMFRVSRRGEHTRDVTVAADVAHEVLGQLQFDRLLNEPAVTPFFQPIVRISDSKTVGYEVLARSQLLGLQCPATMFRVAAERECEPWLSRVCRTEGLQAASSYKLETEIYLNTHPSELGMPELLDSLRELRVQFPDASVLLEVHESGVTSSGYLLELRETLNQLGMRLAYDDFGSGQARLMELVEVPPDILKFDIKMIRDIDSASPQRRSALESLVKIVRDLGVIPLAEGTETQEEADACKEVGFELVQGFLFGRPAPAGDWQTDDNRQTSEDSAC